MLDNEAAMLKYQLLIEELLVNQLNSQKVLPLDCYIKIRDQINGIGSDDDKSYVMFLQLLRQ